jgi:VanZ family protein
MDKFYHLFAYLILGVLAQSAWGFRSLLFGCALGIVTELGQGFIPKRSAEPLDLLVNLLGLLMGTFGAYWFGRLR